MGEFGHGLSGDRLDESARFVMQMREGRASRDVVKVRSDRAYVLRDGPFVVVEHDDEAFGVGTNIVQRFIANPAGERGVTRDHDHVLIAAAQIASHGHAQAGRKRCAGVTRAVAIVLALGAQQKTIKALVLPHRRNAIETAGKHLVHVALMTHVHNKAVARRFEDAMQRDRQLDHTEIRSKMSAGLRKHLDEFVANFLGELRQILFAKRLDICG